MLLSNVECCTIFPMSNDTLPALPEFSTPIVNSISGAFRGKTFSVKIGGRVTEVVYPDVSYAYGDGYTVNDGTYYLKGVQLPYVDVIRDGEKQGRFGARPYLSRWVDDDGQRRVRCWFEGDNITPAAATKLGIMLAEVVEELGVDWDALAVESQQADKHGELRRLHSAAERAIEDYTRKLSSWESK